MSGKVYIGSKASSFDYSPKYKKYSAVRIKGGDIEYTAGDDTGMELVIDNPFGSQAVADDILAAIKGYEYQPISAGCAYATPAAELGDGVTVAGVYGGLFEQDIVITTDYNSDITAPDDSDIQHEIQSDPKLDRKMSRAVSTGTVSAGNIEWGMSDFGFDFGSFSGSGLSLGSIDTSKLFDNIKDSLGFANFSNDVFNAKDTATAVKAGQVMCNSILGLSISETLRPMKVKVTNENGVPLTIWVFGAAVVEDSYG